MTVIEWALHRLTVHVWSESPGARHSTTKCSSINDRHFNLLLILDHHAMQYDMESVLENDSYHSLK